MKNLVDGVGLDGRVDELLDKLLFKVLGKAKSRVR
jgi:hypothetical protein